MEHVGHLALSNQQNPMPFAKVSLTKNHADFSENHLAWFAFHPSERGGDKLITDGFYPISSDVDAAYTWGGYIPDRFIYISTLVWRSIRIHCTFPG